MENTGQQPSFHSPSHSLRVTVCKSCLHGPLDFKYVQFNVALITKTISLYYIEGAQKQISYFIDPKTP